ncbi:hypothetical protein BOTBODRAFT_152296 [Botryobasidium botryosum FD-172 SS1]|uniref:FAD-binding FR-type domain-containing protein n=1 Tax=Botryobasidium botryosum (strain FD-172 SS1) TaxID=930990 RepID=A0A067MW21_BOTB1|nr:hypothetical protein BOTBODRAFT_152296 [Botryobasidium botryosum FD-172 SS1]
MSLDGAPVAPPDLQIYNSYVTDPQYQRYFTIAWTVPLAAYALYHVPRYSTSIRRGLAWSGFGVWEDIKGKHDPLPPSEDQKLHRPATQRTVSAIKALGYGPVLWAIPRLRMDTGQLLVVIVYVAILLLCMTNRAELYDNSNRAGFLAIAQLPAVFLFAMKNNPLSLLLGKGYEKLNFLHRWSARSMFLVATVHGSLWINNRITNGQRDSLTTGTKELRGITAYSLLFMTVVFSLRPIRQRAYVFFFISHVIGISAFFIVICYHTPYATPWIFPAITFYAFDLVTRMLRYRVKDAVLEAVGNQMTLIHIPDCTGGWTAGQHVQLRVFFSSHVFESHPLTILNAPPARTALPLTSASARGITLAARACGDWTRALNALARSRSTAGPDGNSETEKRFERVTVMLDGPYGGLGFDVGDFESVLLVSGGSGATFTIGILDDIIGRIKRFGRRNGERTKRIEFVWYIRSFGAIQWFAPILADLGHAAARCPSLSLHISFYVTCQCTAEDLSSIPNHSVEIGKPGIGDLLEPFLVPQAGTGGGDVEGEGATEKKDIGGGGGVAVIASGPESLVRGAQNAVARVGARRARRVGGVEVHTELFAI